MKDAFEAAPDALPGQRDSEPSAKNRLRSLGDKVTGGLSALRSLGKDALKQHEEKMWAAADAAVPSFAQKGRITEWDKIDDSFDAKGKHVGTSVPVTLPAEMKVGDYIRVTDDGRTYLFKFVPDPSDPTATITIQHPRGGPQFGEWIQPVTPKAYQKAKATVPASGPTANPPNTPDGMRMPSPNQPGNPPRSPNGGPNQPVTSGPTANPPNTPDGMRMPSPNQPGNPPMSRESGS